MGYLVDEVLDCTKHVKLTEVVRLRSHCHRCLRMPTHPLQAVPHLVPVSKSISSEGFCTICELAGHVKVLKEQEHTLRSVLEEVS
eukprot:7465579-Pyramimonas_sp.AAC.2